MANYRAKRLALVTGATTLMACGPAFSWRHHHAIDGYANSFGSYPGTYSRNPSLISRLSSFQPSNANLIAYPRGLVLTINKTLAAKPEDESRKTLPTIDRPKQVAELLATCWSPPVPDRGDTVEVTIRFGLNSRGGVIAPPRITYVKAAQGVSSDDIRGSIAAAVKACTPMHFTATLAAGIPGNPLAVRFVGRRSDDSGQQH